MFNGNTSYSTLSPEQKLRYILTNPALAKAVYLNCDVFSLGKITRVDGGQDLFTQTLSKPNYFQTQRQFLWSYRFFMMFGNAYLKPSTKLLENERGQLYWLNSARIDWETKTIDKLDKMVLSNRGTDNLGKLTLEYTYNDGTTEDIELRKLITFHDLTNNTGNWYAGNSRIDALHKVLFNNESTLDAQNINLEFMRKFLVSGNYDPSKNLDSLATMQNIEKEDIERKLRGNKAVHPIKSQIEIKRFVENMADLQLNETYVHQLLIVADMYGIPKELIGALQEGSTYENQEKALSRHISYSEMPKALDLIEGLCEHFGTNPEDYKMSWDHLPFMQEDESKRSEVNERNVRTLRDLINLGVDIEEAQEFLGLEDLTIDYENRPNQESVQQIKED